MNGYIRTDVFIISENSIPSNLPVENDMPIDNGGAMMAEAIRTFGVNLLENTEAMNSADDIVVFQMNDGFMDD